MIGKSSPWGKIQSSEEMAPGIWWVSTAGHGGIKLSAELNRKVLRSGRSQGGFYEEDCEVSIVILTFPEHFDEKISGQANTACKNYFPEFYQELTGRKLNIDESEQLQQEDFEKKTANLFVVISAWGSWANSEIKENQVLVCATIGGSRSYEVPTEYFLVDSEEYEARPSGFGFVIDTSRHNRTSIRPK